MRTCSSLSGKGTRGSLRWLKKSSQEVLSRGVICMRFWDGSTSNWLKISITCQNFEMAQFFRPETLRWHKIRSSQYLESSFCSNFELSQSLRFEKVSHFGLSTPIWSWAISKSHEYAYTWQYILRWLFELSQGPPRSIFHAYQFMWWDSFDNFREENLEKSRQVQISTNLFFFSLSFMKFELILKFF